MSTNTTESPITVTVDHDPRGVSVGVWQGSHCIYSGAHPLPAAPGVSTVEDERQAFEAWAKWKKMPLARIGQQYDDFWVDHAWNGWQARAALDAPAAGDALDAARWRFVRRKLCLTGNGDGTCAMQAINLPASIPGWPEPGSAVAEFCDAAIDAAIEAQRKGDA